PTGFHFLAPQKTLNGFLEFLRLAAFIEDAYNNSRTFRKMIQIAEHQTKNAANKPWDATGDQPTG
ncbi:MAG: hypothetical protein V4733_01155, partial [Verrucomicrobiota bacterium]